MSGSIAVIGAGLAGLAAAAALAEAGRRVVVLDKGRRPGGRTATRLRDGWQFDHGAQYFTARDPRFRRRVDHWLASGAVAVWPARLLALDPVARRDAGADEERFVGVPGMSAMAADLATRLDVRLGVRVECLERRPEGWRVWDGDGRLVAEASSVLITAPPAQAAALLGYAPMLAARAEAVVMRPCWAVLLGLAGPPGVDIDGAFVNVGPLAWVARNSGKPGRSGGEAWVLHASAAWSEAHLEDDPLAVVAALREALGDILPAVARPEVVHAEAHRWRYAQPDPALDERCVVEEGLRLGLAGDWCGGPRVEGAYLSGLALAERVLAWG